MAKDGGPRAVVPQAPRVGGVAVQAGDGECRLVAAEPRDCRTSRRGVIFSVYRHMFPLLRELGHRGIDIIFVSVDRALFSSCVRKGKQLHHA